jgi:hypothetical protein
MGGGADAGSLNLCVPRPYPAPLGDGRSLDFDEAEPPHDSVEVRHLPTVAERDRDSDHLRNRFHGVIRRCEETSDFLINVQFFQQKLHQCRRPDQPLTGANEQVYEARSIVNAPMSAGGFRCGALALKGGRPGMLRL